MAVTADVLRDVLEHNRREALDLSTRIGQRRLRELLARAEADLTQRLHRSESLKGPGKGSFTAQQLRVTLAQVRDVTRTVKGGMRQLLLSQARSGADSAAGHLVEYLAKADRHFRGVARSPLPLREAAVLDAAREGAQSSLLRRIATSGEPGTHEGAELEPHSGKPGVLDRYGVETVGHFEEVLQRGLLTRKPWGEVRAELVEQSPFLQKAPAYWAERIVRTETMGSYNRAGWEGVREADSQLGDMVKILSATFDDRTSWDSFQLHGQIRRPDQAFAWNGHFFQHPPNRPNDREVVTPHRVSWPLPDTLRWRSDGEVLARFRAEGRKGSPPPRPKMTTVPLERFGRG